MTTTVEETSTGELLRQNQQMRAILQAFGQLMKPEWKNATAGKEVMVRTTVGDIRLARYYSGLE